MMNIAFVNYIDSLDTITDFLKFLILLNRTTYRQALPISLKLFDFNSELVKEQKTLNDFVQQFWHKKEIFDLQDRHKNNALDLPSKIFFQ